MAEDTTNKQAAANYAGGGTNPIRHPKFHWLKAPSIFLIIIGTIGILSARVDYFESAFSFLQLPPLLHSLIITLLAGVLLLISCTCKSAHGGQDMDGLQDNWRSI